jgi:hypothetical protein
MVEFKRNMVYGLDLDFVNALENKLKTRHKRLAKELISIVEEVCFDLGWDKDAMVYNARQSNIEECQYDIY